MKCPQCQEELSKDNFKVEIFREDAQVVMFCKCGHEDVFLGFKQADLC